MVAFASRQLTDRCQFVSRSGPPAGAAKSHSPGLPGTIETPMVTDMITKGELNRTEAAAATPIARLGQAEEIAASVLWLCSPGASFVVGVALPVDGGYTAQ